MFEKMWACANAVAERHLPIVATCIVVFHLPWLITVGAVRKRSHRCVRSELLGGCGLRHFAVTASPLIRLNRLEISVRWGFSSSALGSTWREQSGMEAQLWVLTALKTVASCRSCVWRSVVGLWNAASGYLLRLTRREVLTSHVVFLCDPWGWEVVGGLRGLSFGANGKNKKQWRHKKQIIYEERELKKSVSCITECPPNRRMKSMKDSGQNKYLHVVVCMCVCVFWGILRNKNTNQTSSRGGERRSSELWQTLG